MKFWLFLCALLRPAVGGDDPDPASPAADAASPGDQTDDDPADDLVADPATDSEPDPPADPKPDAGREALARTEKFERELGELKARQPAAQPAIDPEWQREEQRLAAADTTPLEKWQIQANRELRAGRNAANTALAQAYDVADRTAFATLATTEPGLYKRYSARVEEELTKMRTRGQNTTRENIYTYLLGQDMRAGKFTKKSSAAKKGSDPASPQVARGRLPGARSDVGGRTAMSEHQKRAQRLENVQI